MDRDDLATPFLVMLPHIPFIIWLNYCLFWELGLFRFPDKIDIFLRIYLLLKPDLLETGNLFLGEFYFSPGSSVHFFLVAFLIFSGFIYIRETYRHESNIMISAVVSFLQLFIARLFTKKDKDNKNK